MLAALAGGIVGAVLAPAAAGAQVDLPLLPDIPGPSLPGPRDLVRTVLDALFDLLFGDIPKRITTSVLAWLLTHPDFGASSRFDTLERGATAVREVAYAVAVALFCAGLVRNIFDDATTGAVEATRRFVFAIAGITLWPWAFPFAVRFSNLATEAFLEVPEISRTTVALLSFAFIGSAAVGIGFICGLLAAVLLIALFLEKVIVLTALTVLYVLMPALMAASPFPPTSHLFGVGAAALTAVLVINPLWTGLLAVFAIVGEGALLTGAGAVEDFVEPLLAIAMLILVVGSLPLLLRMAWVRGVAAALMTPTVGAHHGGGSALASTATLVRGAQSVRAVLEQQSSERLRESAWHVDDLAMSTGHAAPALPFPGEHARGGRTGNGAESGGTADSESRSMHSSALPERPEVPAPGARDRPALDRQLLASGSSEQTRVFAVDQTPASPARRSGEPPRTEQLRLPLDDTPQNQ